MRLARRRCGGPHIPAIPMANLAMLVLTSVVIAGMLAASRGPALRFASPTTGGRFRRSRCGPRRGRLRERGCPSTACRWRGDRLAASVSARLAGRPTAPSSSSCRPRRRYETMVAAYGAIAGLPGPPRIALPSRPAEGNAMSSLRSLLRLDEKVAAEGRATDRRPAAATGRSAALVAALVPARGAAPPPGGALGASLPPASPPDFPLVWRMASPAAAGRRLRHGRRPSRVAGSHESAGRDRRGTASGCRAGSRAGPRDRATGDAAERRRRHPAPRRPPPPSFEPGGPSSPSPAASTSAPALVQRVPPVYPVLARALRAEARVTVRLTLAADGTVASATVLGCSRPGLGFETAALEATKRWRYEPQPESLSPHT